MDKFWLCVSVETRVKQLNERTAQMLKDVENAYNLALLKIPKAVRQMNWLEVFRKSGVDLHTETKHFHPCRHFTLVSPIMLFFVFPLTRG